MGWDRDQGLPGADEAAAALEGRLDVAELQDAESPNHPARSADQRSQPSPEGETAPQQQEGVLEALGEERYG